MILLGVDLGTTGLKVALFSTDGRQLRSAYREYDVQRPRTGWAELDAVAIWAQVKEAIREVAAGVDPQAIRALAVSSMGEAMVPVTRDRQILGPSLLNFDVRGEEYLESLGRSLDNQRLYQINGNTLGNHYSLTKLMWLRDHLPAEVQRADYYLHWSGFVGFMLGADPTVDYSLANRTLLFDVDQRDWSSELLAWAGLDSARLPRPVPSGTPIGTVAPAIAAELGLSPETVIVAGAHDQCANAVGCGVIEPGSAVYGMGTYVCITPVFPARSLAGDMLAHGLNTEHHAAPDRYVSFIYNHGGSMVKWFRNTFAAEDHRQAQGRSEDVYHTLFAELPAAPSSVLVLPHFATTGPPAFIDDSCGVMVGLRLDTQRGEILKGIVEGVNYYLKETLDALPAAITPITDYRTVGGGSKSDVWVQICADIMGRPFVRPAITEAGALGAAIIAGVGSGEFDSFTQGVEAMVRLERRFEPDLEQHGRYLERYELYRQMGPLMGPYLRQAYVSNRRLTG